MTYLRPERGDSEARFSFNLGGGVKIPLTEHVGLRFEGRALGTLFNGSGSVFCGGDSCAISVKGDLFWQFTAFTGVVIGL